MWTSLERHPSMVKALRGHSRTLAQLSVLWLDEVQKESRRVAGVMTQGPSKPQQFSSGTRCEACRSLGRT